MQGSIHMRVWVSSIIRSCAWSFVGQPRVRPCAEVIQNILIENDLLEDSRTWDGAPDGKFNFKVAFNQIREVSEELPFDIIWMKGVTRKMQFCFNKLAIGRLLTKDRLVRFGLLVEDCFCILCATGIESANHLFFQCPVFRVIWGRQQAKLQLSTGVAQDISEVLLSIRSARSRGWEWFREASIRLAASV